MSLWPAPATLAASLRIGRERSASLELPEIGNLIHAYSDANWIWVIAREVGDSFYQLQPRAIVRIGEYSKIENGVQVERTKLSSVSRSETPDSAFGEVGRARQRNNAFAVVANV